MIWKERKPTTPEKEKVFRCSRTDDKSVVRFRNPWNRRGVAYKGKGSGSAPVPFQSPVPFLPCPGSSARLPLRPASRGFLPLRQPFRLRHDPPAPAFLTFPRAPPVSRSLQRDGTPGTEAQPRLLQYLLPLFILCRFKEPFTAVGTTCDPGGPFFGPGSAAGAAAFCRKSRADTAFQKNKF